MNAHRCHTTVELGEKGLYGDFLRASQTRTNTTLASISPRPSAVSVVKDAVYRRPKTGPTQLDILPYGDVEVDFRGPKVDESGNISDVHGSYNRH